MCWLHALFESPNSSPSLAKLSCPSKERSRCGSSSPRGEPHSLRAGVTRPVRSIRQSPCVRPSILQPGSADKARSVLCGDVLSISSPPCCLAGPDTFSQLSTKQPSGICSDNHPSQQKFFSWLTSSQWETFQSGCQFVSPQWQEVLAGCPISITCLVAFFVGWKKLGKLIEEKNSIEDLNTKTSLLAQEVYELQIADWPSIVGKYCYILPFFLCSSLGIGCYPHCQKIGHRVA